MWSKWRAVWEARVGVSIMLLAVLAGSLYYADVNNREESARCQAAFNEAFTRALTVRSDLATQRQDAVDAVIVGVGSLVSLPPSATVAQQQARSKKFVSLFSEYTEAVAEYDKAREANPLPTLPPDC